MDSRTRRSRRFSQRITRVEPATWRSCLRVSLMTSQVVVNSTDVIHGGLNLRFLSSLRPQPPYNNACSVSSSRTWNFKGCNTKLPFPFSGRFSAFCSLKISVLCCYLSSQFTLFNFPEKRSMATLWLGLNSLCDALNVIFNALIQF